MKICSTCQINKPLSDFSKNKGKKSGHNSVCKDCHKIYVKQHYLENSGTYVKKADEWKIKNPETRKNVANKYARQNKDRQRENTLKRQYGIDFDEFYKMLDKQNNACQICKNEFPDKKYICVDHNHTNGKTRGLLCRNCNWGLGNFKDSKDYLTDAIKYLDRYVDKP